MSIAKNIVYLCLGSLAFLLVYCNKNNQQLTEVHRYKNLSDSVDYLGMQTCISCHSNIHNTFQHTGMGRSFDRASPQKSDSSYTGHELVYDDKNDLYYRPFFRDEVMYIT
ncbi:MAG: hypothetical protein AAF985_21715, partial [Bacteroidota bacterium]